METSANVVGFNFARADLSDPSIGLPNEAPPSLAADPGERPSLIVTDRGRPFPAGARKIVGAGITRVRRLLPSARGESQAEAAEDVGVSSAGRLEEDPDAPLRQDSIGPVQGKGEDGDAVPLRPFWRKVAVLGTVSAIALAVGAGLYVAGPNPQNAGTKAVHQATLAGETGVAGDQGPKVMAPAASLASESPRDSGPVEVALPPLARKSAEIEEVEGFRSGVLSRGGGRDVSAETGHDGASPASPVA